MATKPTPHDRAGAAASAPAMDVYRTPVPQVTVDYVKSGGHLDPGRHSVVRNIAAHHYGVAIRRPDVIAIHVGVGTGWIILSEVDEKLYTGVEQLADLVVKRIGIRIRAGG